MKIKLEAEFGKEIYVNIHIMLFNIIVKTFRIPNKPKPKKKIKKKYIKLSHIKPKKKRKKIKLKGKEVINILIDSSKKINIEYISFKGDIGLGDPAVTALTTGLFYSISGAFIGFLSDHFKISKTKLNIKPHYNTVIIELFAECILNLKIVNIISAAIRLLKLYLKKRKEMCYVRTSNKRTYGNSYAKH